MRLRDVAMIAVSLAVVAMPATVGAQSVEEPADLGDVTLVNETREALSEGNGKTVFGFELPAGASCPGDSRNDQWRVQTFIVPSDVDPGMLTYNSIGPEGDGRYALYGLDTNPVTDVLTAPNGAPGLPGLIIGLRSTSFEIFPPGTLPGGTYRVGVACTYFRDTASYWDTLIEVTRDPEDKPAEIRWSTTSSAARAVSGIVDDGGSRSGSGSGSSTVAIVAVAILAIAGSGVYFARRSRREPVYPKEMS